MLVPDGSNFSCRRDLVKSCTWFDIGNPIPDVSLPSAAQCRKVASIAPPNVEPLRILGACNISLLEVCRNLLTLLIF
jgi:hypothetical protein